MNDFEKVDKIRERASVSYEEAREALQHANGDLLDAMVYLEQQGKTVKPAVSTYSTRYEEQNGYEKVERNEGQEEDSGKRFRTSLKNFLSVIFHKLTDNYISVINRQNVEAVRLPLIIPVILLIAGWYAFIPVMVILLFFGFRYQIVGKDEMPNANEILNRAGEMAEHTKERVKEEFR